ncbi:MAG TPA: hypothetical protein VEI02_10505, partial [Planctomycetota bacterium]|nr:hypothetical protein [Planctomycetota bacterium]
LRLRILRAVGPWDVLEREVGRDGSLRAFHVVGPFGFDAMHYGGVAFPPEGPFEPDRTFEARGGAARWTLLETSPAEEDVDLSSALREGPGAAYATAEIVCAADAPLRVALTCSDSAELFVDGRRTLVLDRATEFLPATARVDLLFPKGAHRFLVKLSGAYGRSFRLRLLGLDGAPVDLSSRAGATATVVASRELRPASPTAPAHTAPEGGPPKPTDLRRALAEASTRAERLLRATLLAEEDCAELAVEIADAVSAANDASPGEVWACRRIYRAARHLPDVEAKARARAAAKKFAALDPAHPLGIAAAAEEDAENDRGEKGLETLGAALEKHPRAVALREAEVEIFGALGFDADRERALLALEAAYPDGPAALDGAAQVRRARGDDAGALATRRRSLEADGSDAGLRFEIARWELRRGDLAAAEATLTELTRRHPRWSDARLRLADVRREAGDADGERRELEAAAAAFPYRVDALKLLLHDAVATGSTDRAVAFAEDVLKRDPDDDDARRALDRLRPRSDDVFREFAIDAEAFLKTVPGKEAYPDSAMVLLLDQVVLHIRADGTAEHEVHQLHRMQDARAKGELGTVRTQGRVTAVRTITPDGRTLWPNSLRAGTYEMAGLAPGVVVERRYRYDVDRFLGRPEDFGGFYFQDTDLAAPFHLTRYVVVVPKAMNLEPLIERFPGAPRREERGDDVVWEFKLERMPRLKNERAMPPPDEIVPYVAFKRGDGMAALNRRLLDRFEPHARPTPEIRRAAAEAVGDAVDPLDKARRIYRWVMDRTPTEDGGGTPTATLLERSGPRLPLYCALLSAAGVPWRPAAARLHERLDKPARWELLDDEFFSYPTARVEPPGGAPVYVALDARFRAFGELPFSFHDAPAFVAGRDGGFLDRTPAAPLSRAAGLERSFDLRIDADGVASGAVRARFGGDAAASFREQLAMADRKQLDQALLRMLLDPVGKFGAKPKGPVRLEGAERGDGPLTASVEVEIPRLLKEGSSGHVLQSPLPPLKLARRFVDRAERTQPVLFRDFEVAREEARFALDPTWRVTGAPETFVTRGAPGSFSLRRVVSEGSVLIERLVQFEPFQVAAERFAPFAAWLKALDEAEERQITLEKTRS